MQVFRAKDAVWTRWKNGGGLTREIIAFPPRSGVTDFDWRVSTARIETGGPFSIFPDVDRTLVVLEGEGVSLFDEEGSATHLDVDAPPFTFNGEAYIEAVLAGGPVLDLNVMTRRGAYKASVNRLAIEGSHSLTADAGEMVILVSSIDAPLHLGGTELELFAAIHLVQHEYVTLHSPGAAAVVHTAEMTRLPA